MRYILFSTAFTFVVVIALLTKNFIGAILLFFLLGGYLFFGISLNQLIKISIDTQGLIIWGRTYPWNKLTGFAVDVDKESHEIKNVIFFSDNQKLIHTVEDTQENIKEFVISLNENIPLTWEYQETSLEKILRTLKL